MLKEAIYVRGLVKYKNKCVLNNVSFMAFKGEVLGLVGNHGSGLSTLADILCGLDRPDSGSIAIMGKRIVLASKGDAERQGVCHIDQGGLLVNEMNAAENLCLSYPPIAKGLAVSKRTMERTANEILEGYRIRIDVRKYPFEMSAYEKDAVAMIKMTLRGAKILILENVMLNYNAEQRADMQHLLGRLTDMGMTVIIVSPEAESIIDVADRLIVFARGFVQGTFRRSECDANTVNALMSPHAAMTKPPLKGCVCETEVMRLEGFVTQDCRFPDITVHAGEVVGFLDGSGNVDKRLIHVLRGVQPYSGRLFIDERPVRIETVRDALSHRITYLTAYDSPLMLQENLSIEDNFLLINPAIYSKAGFINRRMQRFACREYLKDTGLSPEILKYEPRFLTAHVRNEINLIKLRAMKPRILLLDDPFINADASMKAAIYDFILEMVNSGAGVIMGITSEDEQDTVATRLIRLG